VFKASPGASIVPQREYSQLFGFAHLFFEGLMTASFPHAGISRASGNIPRRLMCGNHRICGRFVPFEAGTTLAAAVIEETS
jgi:hypothetical protein